MIHILVVEDEPSLCQLLVNNLGFEGYSVEAVGDGVPALSAHTARRADLIVLDLMLPQLDGFEVLRTLRERKDEVPVLLLTARGEETDRVKGLSLGADDYLVKPFSVLELMARVKAILRRTRPVDRPARLRSGPFQFDLPRLEARRDGKTLELTPREFRLLEILISHAGRTHSRKELLQLAWEPDARPSARTVDVHIANLRRKLGEELGSPWITTVGGEGYRWITPVEPDPGAGPGGAAERG
ncbi:response regulator transcription factor [Geothrix edaphica]|uniref:DNA-binding response regulator n=1 Tax=Geothrix edaphica TaxID=2927976 RepID=A0ABQ5Q0W8_9BACT|nr:response regulator transcription factor [Geothrix edaphica]GLH68267.1 DNA-binding response regulator [Geothrix edaphica]